MLDTRRLFFFFYMHMQTHSPGLLVSEGFCIHNQDGHLQPRPKIQAAACASSRHCYRHTCAHLYPTHTLHAVPQRNGTAVEKQDWRKSETENERFPLPSASPPLPPAPLFSSAGWVIYIEQDPILAAAAEDSASQGQPVLPPCTIFSNRTASNSRTKLFLSLCCAPSAAAAPAKGTGCVCLCVGWQ